MSPRFLCALAILGSLLLAGCFPESTNPLSTPATSTVDPRLEGVYVAHREKPDDALSVWHLHYRGEKTAAGASAVSPWLEILNIDHPRNRALEGTAYRVLTTHFGAHDYMSILELGNVTSPENGLVKPSAGGGGRQQYWIARYEIGETGVLRVWMMNTKSVEEAIKAGKIRGLVKPHKEGDDVLLTDSTEDLAKFVTKSDTAALFAGKPITLYRLSR